MGGDEKCNHRVDRFANRKITDNTRIDQSKQKSLAGEFVANGQQCPKCGAIRQDKQIGLEETPDCKLRGFMKLRADLTPNQQAFVAQRLKDEGYFYV